MHISLPSLVLRSLFSALTLALSTAHICNEAPQVLTSSCASVCFDSQSCLVYNASDTTCTTCVEDADQVCSYECFTIVKEANEEEREENEDTTAAVFLIPFGSYQSEEELQERSSNSDYDMLIDDMPDKTDQYPFVNNDLLTRIDSMVLLDSTTQVTVSGGTDFDYVVRGKVVNVTLAEDLFSNQTQVTNVSLISIDLKHQADNLMTLLPPNLQTLTNLSELFLCSNYFTSVSASESIQELTYLCILDNEIESFEGYFPNLVTLNLSGNKLKEVPAVIFDLRSLKELYLDGNPLTKAKFTSSQVEFLRRLTVLDLHELSFVEPLDCTAEKQERVHNVTVCVSGLDDDDDDEKTNAPETIQPASGGNIGAIIAVVLVVVLVGLGIGVFVWRSRRKSGKDHHASITELTAGCTGSTDGRSGSHEGLMSIWNDTKLLELQLRSEDIQDIKKLGNGANGVVWLVRYHNSQLLASKRIQRDQVTRERTQAFVDEIKLVAKFDHPNIVAFIGAAWSMETNLQALFEYMENGDLREHLIKPSTPRQWDLEKLQIAVDVVEALVYVHSFQPPIVHRDLKSRNILLSAEMHAKLTDFGVSRFRSQDHTMTIGVGTSRWLAPEIISGSNDYGQAADIYSFGVVLSELDTHNIPYNDACGAAGNLLADVAILQMVATGILQPKFNASCPPEILELANRCLAHNPKDRPASPQIAYELRKLRKTYI